MTRNVLSASAWVLVCARAAISVPKLVLVSAKLSAIKSNAAGDWLHFTQNLDAPAGIRMAI